MDAAVASDPAERSAIKVFIDKSQRWARELPRVGLADFDVKKPEELVKRVGEYKEVQPRTTIVKVPEPPKPGFLTLRQEYAALAAGVLITLLTTTNTEVLAQSNERTNQGFHDKCAELLIKAKVKDPLGYQNYLARTDSLDPDGNFVQICIERAKLNYDGYGDALDGVIDGEKALRVGFVLTMAGGIASTVAGAGLLAASVFGRFKRRVQQAPS